MRKKRDFDKSQSMRIVLILMEKQHCYFNKKGEAVVIYNTYCEIGCAKYFFLLVVSFMIQNKDKI